MKFRDLSLSDLDAVLELQNAVYDSLEDKEVLQILTREEFEGVINQGYIIGVFKGQSLVATRSMYIPQVDEEEHLADDAKIQNKERVIYSEITFIDPASRGQGLQTKMGEALIQRVRESGNFDHILTTVMPTNIPSLKDKFKLGFKIVKTTYKYGGKKRHVLLLDLLNEIELIGEAKKIHFEDTEWMLNNSEYYIGDSLTDKYINYYKKK
ncbi:N-acetyltransferase family protein [Salinicoccus sp. HZC-1]|uniref:GNAT family N-acetyltransferase n=1 Tax=Salinicoccus sp. HZC-1 TaxID=3385497 RepID=UPI00398BB7D5